MSGAGTLAALIGEASLSALVLERLAAAQPDARLLALAVRRRAVVLRLRKAAEGRSGVREGTPAARGPLPTPDLAAVIATEWRLARTCSAITDTLAETDPLRPALQALCADSEEAALSLRVIALARGGG
jgi:hypothetical protein